MSNCLPFSEVDQYLSALKEPKTCLYDTTLLISLTDKDHPFNEDAQFLHEKLVEYDAKIFVGVTARSEFIDYHRRVILTETLMDMLAPSSKWKISASVREILKKQRGWIDNQPNQENAHMRADDSKDLFRKELKWPEMYRLAEASGLGSQDAMILNLLDSSIFPFVVTMDFDLAYGVMASTKDKTVLVPDNLYRNRLKTLKF